MGLDMYLEAEFYVKNWDHAHYKWKVTVEGGPQDGFWKAQVNGDKVSRVIEEIGYWRKANAVHKWIVDHCANGVDQCQAIYMDSHDVTRLKRICKLILGKSVMEKSKVSRGDRFTASGWEPILEDGKVIANPERYAARYLPTGSGFFFGSTDYDDWYMSNVEKTLAILNDAEDAIARGGSIHYRASW